MLRVKNGRASQMVDFPRVITILQRFSPIFHPVWRPEVVGFSPVGENTRA
jgi:hypothetical protein